MEEGDEGMASRMLRPIVDIAMTVLLLLSMAYGLYTGSGLSEALSRKRHGGKLAYLHNFALKVVAAEAVVSVIILTLLLALPSGPMLSVTGQVFPSSFSRSLVPVVCFGVCLMAVSFGLATGRFRGVADVFSALSSGVAMWLPLWLLYVLVIQLWCSVSFVFFG